ncbi:MAG: hypothetical protein DRP16_02850 [Candidatus Aenigmatarchaeota archaeon]|nr:MAG: hypothetical protein DRP16_02850 [Candidatus Aenigmarchaeota archaeon]
MVETDTEENSSEKTIQEKILLRLMQEERKPVTDFSAGGSVVSSPLVRNGVVYFGSCDKNFYALDAENGKMLWSFPTEGPVVSPPTISNNTIYFGSYDHNLYAVSLNGKLKWAFPAQERIFSKPSVFQERVYFASCDGVLYSVNVRTGKCLWKFKTNAPILSQPKIYKKTIFFGSNDYNFYALTLDGKPKWKFETGKEAGFFNSVIYNDTVYFGSFDSHIYALKANTGNLVWKFDATKPPNTPIKRKDNFLFFGTRTHFYAINTEGKLVWKLPIGNHAGSGVSVFRDMVFFSGNDNHLYGVDAKTGKVVWKFRANGYISHTCPAFYNGKIYFGCWDCSLYCVTQNAELVWRFETSLSCPSLVFSEQNGQETEKQPIEWEETEEKETELEEKKEFEYGEPSEDYTGELKNYLKGKKYMD